MCLLTTFSKLNLLDKFCKFQDKGVLLRNLAVCSSSAFEIEIKVFWNAYGKLFLESILKYINTIITDPSVTEWIFAIPIVHYLTGQHNSVNSIEWNEDPLKLK